ncbi:MAG: vWA domain-containing protein [Gemmataceae bacterium]
MNRLMQMLGIEAPENASLRSAELAFRGLLPAWLALVLLVALGAMTVWLYLHERGKFGWFRRSILACLRIGLFGLILFLLARPLLLTEFEGERNRGVVYLVDNSQSMTQKDRRVADADKQRVAVAWNLLPADAVGGTAALPDGTPKDPSRVDVLRKVLENSKMNLLEETKKTGPLRLFTFGARVRGLQEEGDADSPLAKLQAGLKGDESKTTLADSIHDILQRKDGDPPTAIVVATDGQDNASKNTLAEAAQACKRANIPLFVYGVGSSEGGSLQIREVAMPNTLFADDTVSLPIRWRAQGLKKGNVEFQVTLGDKTVYKKEFAIQSGDDLRTTLDFMVPKLAEGKEEAPIKVRVRNVGDDSFSNEWSGIANVADRKIRVLYIENAPRFEYKFLQAMLLRDRRIEPTFYLAQATDEVKKSGPPFLAELPTKWEEFAKNKFNVVILGDIAADKLGKDALQWLEKFVANERGGLIALSGRQHMPSSYGDAKFLPVEFVAAAKAGSEDVRTQEYQPTLTESGLRSGMMSLADSNEENRKLWETLPGFHWFYPTTKLRPGAQALVVNPRAKSGDQPAPIVATQFYGQGQVIWLATDETWRWRANVENKHFARLWGQMVYQAGLPSLLKDRAPRASMSMERGEAFLDQPSSVYLRLLDSKHEPRKDASVEATLEYLDAKAGGGERIRKVTLQAIPGREGEYRTLMTNDRPGKYKLTVNNPEPTSFDYEVQTPPQHELADLGLNEKALRDLAVASGGRFYREEDLHRLPSDLPVQKATFAVRQEVLLWNPLIFVVFLTLIVAEWLVRKFSDLS